MPTCGGSTYCCAACVASQRSMRLVVCVGACMPTAPLPAAMPFPHLTHAPQPVPLLQVTARKVERGPVHTELREFTGWPAQPGAKGSLQVGLNCLLWFRRLSAAPHGVLCVGVWVCVCVGGGGGGGGARRRWRRWTRAAIDTGPPPPTLPPPPGIHGDAGATESDLPCARKGVH